MHTWWKPERDPKAVVGALRGSGCKGASSEGSEYSRDVQQILMRVTIDPARYRIGAKGQNQRGDGSPAMAATYGELTSMAVFRLVMEPGFPFVGEERPVAASPSSQRQII